MTLISEQAGAHPLGRAMRSAQQVIVGKSPAAQALKQMVWLAASSGCPLLLTGERGTGKREVAGAIHMASSRGAFPYVALNCATMATQEADKSWQHITQCSGGTLFLDDIHALPQKMQLKILQLIDNGTLANTQAANIRLIAATDQCLISLAGEGEFLPDLYYRLSLMTLPVPTLRQRRADIPLMVEQILLMIAPHDRLSLDDGAMRLLCAHDWPGNLFELRALIHRAVGLHPGQRIGEASVKMMLAMGRPHRMSLPGAEPCEGQIKLQPGFNIKAFLDEEERHFLHSALLKTDGNVQAAADLTGVTLSTFVKRMQKHGLTVSQYRNNDIAP